MFLKTIIPSRKATKEYLGEEDGDEEDRLQNCSGRADIDACYAVTEWVLKETFQQLYYMNVALEGIVLKPNMVTPGLAAVPLAPATVASATLFSTSLSATRPTGPSGGL